jgi:hypothetical protein
MLTSTIGTARRDICACTNATPSIPGMLRSQVITSGRSASAISSASSPSREVPTTSRNGLRDSIWLTILRTYAESSTTSTRRILLAVGATPETSVVMV